MAPKSMPSYHGGTASTPLPCKEHIMVIANTTASGLSQERLQRIDRFLQASYIDAGKIPAP